MKDCSNSSALAMELLQSCIKPSKFLWVHVIYLQTSYNVAKDMNEITRYASLLWCKWNILRLVITQLFGSTTAIKYDVEIILIQRWLMTWRDAVIQPSARRYWKKYYLFTFYYSVTIKLYIHQYAAKVFVFVFNWTRCIFKWSFSTKSPLVEPIAWWHNSVRHNCARRPHWVKCGAI